LVYLYSIIEAVVIVYVLAFLISVLSVYICMQFGVEVLKNLVLECFIGTGLIRH